MFYGNGGNLRFFFFNFLVYREENIESYVHPSPYVYRDESDIYLKNPMYMGEQFASTIFHSSLFV